MLHVRTLGGFSVTRAGDAAPAALQPRRLAVLAVIARAGMRGVTRDRLIALVWPDADDEAGRKAVSQALWALRRELREDELFEGVQELRLNPAVATCDVVEFEAARSAGDVDRATSLYEGSFLEGFRLAGVPEFERWADEERTALAHRYAAVLEQAARDATVRGDAAAAAGWWRRLAAHDPLNGRIAIQLMEALVAAGDRTGALQHARIYEALIEQELELPPDAEVVALAARIRQAAAGPAAARTEPTPSAPRTEPMPPTEHVESSAGQSPELSLDTTSQQAPERVPDPDRPPGPAAVRPWVGRLSSITTVRPRAVAAVLALVVLASMSAYALRRAATGPAGSRTSAVSVPVLAVGHIADYTGEDNIAPALADMLATSLARTEGLRVISTPRLYSLAEGGYQAEHLAAAARKAGANVLVEASIYRAAGGGLRLDLRRSDLGSGALQGAHSVEAGDLFTLADEGTRSLLQSLGARVPAGGIGGVSTRSAAAYTLYEQGLRIYLNGNTRDAIPLFNSALAEDSTFAMAAFYRALSQTWRPSYEEHMRTALRLAEHASDRERLFIRVNWAYEAAAPALYALADSLVTRYPLEVEGHLYLGRALYLRGDYLAAVPHLTRAISMDSAAIRRVSVPCHGCAALRWVVATYAAADSLDTAIRWARRWVEQQPQVADAWWRLAEVLEFAGHGDESVDAAGRAMNIEPGRPYGWRFETGRGIRTAQFDDVDPILRSHLNTGTVQHRSGARWMLAISLRHQGRLAESLAEARINRANVTNSRVGDAVNWIGTAEALAMLHAGDWRGAAALFDSIARYPFSAEPSLQAQHQAWFGAHAATALAAGGDVADLEARADSVEAWGRRSAQGRDLMLHHYVRGLLLAHQGSDEAAAASFRRAIVSPTVGFTRANLELARALMRLGRPGQAVAPLQASLRGNLEMSNLYVTHTELHEALALAWDAAGVPDSAAANYAWVARAWRNADPELQPRRAAAERRLQEIRAAQQKP
jgi:DNA-binding SARP family transcriptional activator/tetratricopeptide (TPR) repeat protein